MSCCACCCFYPKYKRKVDNIYPRSPDAPLVKNEVDKLQYYVQIHPEKLSKIGDYLYQNLKWGLSGAYKNRNYVKNTIEAVDKILLVITPQNLNYYAVNYLKIIQKLLEQGSSGGGGSGSLSANGATNLGGAENVEYQKLAADMFVKFCEKEASNMSTANYNTNYDTFVCQFSSMCYNNNRDERVRAEIRSSGLKCLATMVKRVVPDDSLRASYLWDNMDKIVPALLYIMHEQFSLNASKNPTKSQEEQDAELEHNLDRYLYGDFYFRSKDHREQLKSATSVVVTQPTGIAPLVQNELDEEDDEYAHGEEDARVEIRGENGNDLDKIKIRFKKANKADDVNASSNVKASEHSSPDEHGAMIRQDEIHSRGAGGALESSALSQVIDPDHEAKMLLKNLSSKADYTTISKITAPILTYLDVNNPTGWENQRFVRCIFLIVMYNVKQQHPIVVKELIKHLDSHRNSSAQLKCYIINAINVCIRIAAMHSVGTTGQIIEIFTNLLKHLNFSVSNQVTFNQQLLSKRSALVDSLAEQTASTMKNSPTSDSLKDRHAISEEQKLQREIMNSMGQFTNHLPDYAKNDVIMFICRQINSQQFNYTDLSVSAVQSVQQHHQQLVNAELKLKYFECMYEICSKYRPLQMFAAFTSMAFLEDMLRLTLVNDANSRRKAHEIIQYLMDKSQIISKIRKQKPLLFSLDSFLPANSEGIVTIKSASTLSLKSFGATTSSSSFSLSKPTTLSQAGQSQPTMTRNQTYLSQLDLNEKNIRLTTSREDIQFMRKHGRLFLAHLNENLFMANNKRENFESIYLTICLLVIGLFNEKEFLVDFIRFGFHVQELALHNYEHNLFTFHLQSQLHKFVCAYFLLLSKSFGIASLYRYCSDICDLRRESNLFRFAYPEYILLDEALLKQQQLDTQAQVQQQKPGNYSSGSTSGIQSASNISLGNEVESEFKRELFASARLYCDNVQRSQQQQQSAYTNESKEELANSSSSMNKKLSASKKSLANSEHGQSEKMAAWLFDKKIIADLLENEGFSTTMMFIPNSDYSLSVSYLHQTISSLQTVLRFRSPYSNSVDSIAAFNNIPTSTSVNSGIGVAGGGSATGGADRYYTKTTKNELFFSWLIRYMPIQKKRKRQTLKEAKYYMVFSF
jgi:hypothetical protein